MICHTCGSTMENRVTDLPFKLGEHSILIIKGLPIIQCPQCNEYALSDEVMTQVEQIIQSVDRTTELEVVRYAA